MRRVRGKYVNEILMYEYSEINLSVGFRKKIRVKYDIQKGQTEPWYLLGISQLPSYVKMSFVPQYIVVISQVSLELLLRSLRLLSPVCFIEENT
jgi:hypothetical protein